jgi:chitin disaccharide deacetylase
LAATTSRRAFIRAGLSGIAALLARPAMARAEEQPASPRYCIVNADDLGLSAEIDAGLFEAHDHGIVTSTSLIVDGPDAESAIQQVRQRPMLGLGIHVAFDERGKLFVDVQDLAAVQREIDRQLTRFVRLVGEPPTHIDSHHHLHRLFNVARLFLEAGRRYGVPVRGFSEVVYVGRFYGQPEFGRTDLSKISVETLVGMLQALRPGITEISCHPGHVETRPDAVYNKEREVELATLTDERVKAAIGSEGIRLINYRDYAQMVRARR